MASWSNYVHPSVAEIAAMANGSAGKITRHCPWHRFKTIAALAEIISAKIPWAGYTSSLARMEKILLALSCQL